VDDQTAAFTVERFEPNTAERLRSIIPHAGVLSKWRFRSMKIDGGCHCGYITYEAEADPEKVGICH